MSGFDRRQSDVEYLEPWVKNRVAPSLAELVSLVMVMEIGLRFVMEVHSTNKRFLLA